MGGSGLETIPNRNWSNHIVTQELLEAEVIEAVVDGQKKRVIYEISVTSLLHFKGRKLTEIVPVIDLTVKASQNHPISGTDTIVILALVAK